MKKVGRPSNHTLEQIIIEILKYSRIERGKKKEILKKFGLSYKTSLRSYKRMFIKRYG